MSELYRLLVKSKDTRFAQFSQQILPDLKERFRIYNKEMRQQCKSSIKRTVNKIESPQSDVKPNDASCLGLIERQTPMFLLKTEQNTTTQENLIDPRKKINAIVRDLSNNISNEFTKTLLKNSESDNTADSRNINFSVQETKAVEFLKERSTDKTTSKIDADTLGR